MLQISDKGKALPISPIRRLVPLANKAKERGIKIYHLNIGQPDIETPKGALEVLRNTDLKVIEYTASDGNKNLRKKMAEYFNKRGGNFNENEIVITTGGSEAILFSFLITLNPGDEIIMAEPFYANYISFATITGAVVKTVGSSIENNFALPPMSEFEKIITPKTKGIVLINPNNPTGYLYTKNELTELAKIVKKHNLYLYADEVYREYCYDGLEHYSVINFKDIEQNVILCDSLSKTYSECGIRIGAILSKNKEVMAAAMKFAMARLCPPALGQIVAEASYDTPQEYFTSVREEYIKRRNFMVEALNNMPGVYCPTPKGAFYSIVKLPVDDADKFAEWMLEKFEYNGQTVMVAPASGFYSDPKMGRNQVRMAYVLKISELEKAMEILALALKQYPGRVE
ncbi:MAG: pyridoxal phosphate-dependent aminotransferase [Culturomica sp.]|jgi:aspartate aminotransferase|nr:pyridoxal phosphate-dependent aminotransferase [Culturomica sp.]